MKVSNTLEGFLSRIKILDIGKLKLTILLSALLAYTPALANPTTAVINSFDPVKKYCELSKNPNDTTSLSEILSRSGLSYQEQRVIESFYEGISKEELDQMCLEEHSKQQE